MRATTLLPRVRADSKVGPEDENRVAHSGAKRKSDIVEQVVVSIGASQLVERDVEHVSEDGFGHYDFVEPFTVSANRRNTEFVGIEVVHQRGDVGGRGHRGRPQARCHPRFRGQPLVI